MTAVRVSRLVSMRTADQVQCVDCDWFRGDVSASTARRIAREHVDATGHDVGRISPRWQLYRTADRFDARGWRLV